MPRSKASRKGEMRINTLVGFMGAPLLGNDGCSCQAARRALQYHSGEEMSRHNFHVPAWLTAPAPLLVLVALVVAALWISCESDDQSEEGLDKYFLRDVAAVQALGLQVYWLGTEFTVDGQVFRGPYGFEYGPEVEGAGIEMTYMALLPDGGGVPLDLFVYSSDLWESVKDRTMNPQLPGVTRRAVSVQDREGELILQSAGARPLNAIWLILDLGDVVVVAQTNSVIGATPTAGSDLNPIVNNPDLLIQVMEGLRPYPE
jgi:hypothetical protein